MKKFSASFRLKNATLLSTESQGENKKQGIINYIDPTIITYISKVHHEKERPRKIASINEFDNKDINIYDSQKRTDNNTNINITNINNLNKYENLHTSPKNTLVKIKKLNLSVLF